MIIKDRKNYKKMKQDAIDLNYTNKEIKNTWKILYGLSKLFEKNDISQLNIEYDGKLIDIQDLEFKNKE